MRGYLIIDTEDKRVSVEVTNTQINSLIPIIKKVNKNLSTYINYDGYELFSDIIKSNSISDEDDIVSINIVYKK